MIKLRLAIKKRKPVPTRDGLPFAFSEKAMQAAFLQFVYASARKMRDWACEKTRVFSCVLLLMDVIVVILHKKRYSSPFPIRMLL